MRSAYSTRCCVTSSGRALLSGALFVTMASLGYGQSIASSNNRTSPRALPPLPAESSVVPRADAGDDQYGIVGSRMTLNGNRSGPQGRIGFRWLQVEGPPVSDSSVDGYLHEFVPVVPGKYRFALVVAADKYISPPDIISIVVVASPPSSLSAPPSTLMAPSVEALATQVLASVEGGSVLGNSLAETFESVAGRLDLYRSYQDLFVELSRRLESILPTDPSRRSAWIERVMTPLSRSMVETLRLENLDLARPDHQTATLTLGQRIRLAQQFRAIGRGFRAMPPVR